MPVRYYRKVIRIRAEDSPNVKLALGQIAAGQQPTGEMVLEGVLPYEKYVERRKMWSPQRQCIGLDGMFYRGAEEWMWPPDWLAFSERLADALRGKRRHAKAVGVDPGEGSANTVWTATDEFGVIEQKAMKTPRTSTVVGETIAFGKKHGVPPENWIFDAGGGGRQHSDRLLDKGYEVRCVGFGERPTLDVLVAGTHFASEREAHRDRAYDYRSLRVQFYWELMLRCDPQYGGYAIPSNCQELLRQLSLIPKLTDDEGRPRMLKKHSPKREEDTLTKRIGHSPDEADSAVLAEHVVLHRDSGKLIEAG